jgi:glycosyltransferase involved in cell wall biosynthesis
MAKHYVFFIRDVLPKPEAHLVQATNSANAAANLGYSTILVYLQKGPKAVQPISWIAPIQIQEPDVNLARFYNLQPHLKVVPLPMPWPVDHIRGKLTNSSTIVSRYYFPFHIRPVAQLVHTRDWNFVKTAIKHGVPAIYEHHHHDNKRFEPEIVQHPLFQISVTVADTIRQSMINNGMPAEKVVKLHNGFNRSFLIRHLDDAEQWRQKLLPGDRSSLIVYSGALYRFKGINVLIEAAKLMPHVQFVLAGGPNTQVSTYQELCRQMQVNNVKFLGFVPQNELASLLQAADVLAHPHCSGEAATFTSPLKLFDYMASGTPIVSTEIPPLMEFQSSNAVAGWCQPDNPQELAECLQSVLEHYPRKPEGYVQGTNFVQQFSWENRIARILSYVDEVYRPKIQSS